MNLKVSLNVWLAQRIFLRLTNGHFAVLEDEPFHQFKLQVKSEGHDEENSIGYACSLKFTYTPTYPEEIPTIEILDDVGLDDEQLERLQDALEKNAEENLGMVMYGEI